MRFSHTMSQLLAAATVNGTEAIVSCVKANERDGEDRLECLMEAKGDLEAFLADLNRAIAVESSTPADAAQAIDAVLGRFGAA